MAYCFKMATIDRALIDEEDEKNRMSNTDVECREEGRLRGTETRRNMKLQKERRRNNNEDEMLMQQLFEFFQKELKERKKKTEKKIGRIERRKERGTSRAN